MPPSTTSSPGPTSLFGSAGTTVPPALRALSTEGARAGDPVPLGGLFAGPLPLPVSEVAAECCTALVAGKDAERATDAAGGALAGLDPGCLPRGAGEEDASDMRLEAIGREGEPCGGDELARDEGAALLADRTLFPGSFGAPIEGRSGVNTDLVGGGGAGRLCVYHFG